MKKEKMILLVTAAAAAAAADIILTHRVWALKKSVAVRDMVLTALDDMRYKKPAPSSDSSDQIPIDSDRVLSQNSPMD
jgi:hypothetical protein